MNPRDDVPLRQYIEAILREHEKRYDERMNAAKEAVEARHHPARGATRPSERVAVRCSHTRGV